MTATVLAEYLDCERERAQLRDDNERLAVALAEYTARAVRMIAAQQAEIVRLRADNATLMRDLAAVPWDYIDYQVYWAENPDQTPKRARP